MHNHNKLFTVLDIFVLVFLFIFAVFMGKVGMNQYGDSLMAFNIPALSVLIIGDLAWSLIKRLFVYTLNHKRNLNVSLEKKKTGAMI